MRVLAPRPRSVDRKPWGAPLPTNHSDLEDWEPTIYRSSPFTTVLTRMERNVLESLCEGKSNRMIAADWGLAEDTIKSHIKNLMAKIGARDRTHAVALVYSGVVVIKYADVTVTRRPQRTQAQAAFNEAA